MDEECTTVVTSMVTIVTITSLPGNLMDTSTEDLLTIIEEAQQPPQDITEQVLSRELCDSEGEPLNDK